MVQLELTEMIDFKLVNCTLIKEFMAFIYLHVAVI